MRPAPAPSNLRRETSSSPAVILLLISTGVAGCLAILWATARWGVGVSADSTVYIAAARSLLSQGSLQDVDAAGRAVPMVHYPPLFSFLLAALSWVFHAEPVGAARWLAAGLFGINITLLGAAAWRVLNSWRLGLTAAVLALLFTPMVALHQMALSEPLYVCLALSGFLLLLRDLENPSMSRLVWAAAVAGLAFLTRYAGVAVVISGSLSLLFLQRKRFSSAVRDVLIYGSVSCLPVAAWLARNRMESGTASDFFNGKDLNLATSLGTISAGINTASTWMFPGNLPGFLRIAASIAGVLALCGAAYIYGKRQNIHRDILPAAASLFVICNLAVLLVTVLVLDGTTPMDDRLLLPLFAPLALLLLWHVQSLNHSEVPKAVRVLPVLVIGLLLVTNSLRSVKHLMTTAKSGRGYSAQEWQNSTLIAQLRAAPGEFPIYTTLPSAIRFLTNRPARQLPNTFSPRTERKNENYEQEMSALFRESRDPGVAVVYFKVSAARWYPAEVDLAQSLALTLMTSDSQGSLYLTSRLVPAQRAASAVGSGNPK